MNPEPEKRPELTLEEILKTHKPTAKTNSEAVELAFQMYPEEVVGEELLKEEFWHTDSKTKQRYRSPLFKLTEWK
jgi:hypothetical protein